MSRSGTLWIALVAVLLLHPPLALAGRSWTGKVVGVADGDTITVLRDQQPVKVRLHGIDAPEKDQAFGEKAKQLTSKLVFGKEVKVDTVTMDKYGRTVAIVFLDGARTLNDELLRAGLAWWFRKYSPRDKKLASLEAAARAAKRGLWAEASPKPPWEFRHPDQVKPVAAVAPARAAYHGNLKSRVLHAPGCSDYDCKSCSAGFKTLDDGKKAGYRAHAACVVPFERCYGACLRRNMARAVGWEMIEAECRRECSPAARGSR